ncbi:UNVERIFIED_CONTAM: hypothetical protein GTU68_061087 [Idotea baltica]|nr:hypothetical protein [Idotea baltica]
MSGGTINHNRIAANLLRDIGMGLMERECEVLGSDMKVRIEAADAFVYPDVTVLCGAPEYYDEQKHVITNPMVVFEVLSASTEGFDRGHKFHYYKTIPTLQEYVLLAQDSTSIDLFRRAENGIWTNQSYLDLQSVLYLESIDLDLSLDRIYHRVEDLV